MTFLRIDPAQCQARTELFFSAFWLFASILYKAFVYMPSTFYSPHLVIEGTTFQQNRDGVLGFDTSGLSTEA